MSRIFYDFIIIGGGLSGLTLAARLAAEFPHKQTLVFESKDLADADKSLTYWHPKTEPFPDLAVKSWDKLSVGSGGDLQTYQLNEYQLTLFNTYDYFGHLLEKIAYAPNAALVRSDVRSVIEYENSIDVITDAGDYSSEIVFDSRWSVEEMRQQVPDHVPFLTQHFYTWHIRTEEASFDDSTFTFMDYCERSEHVLCFTRVYPTSSSTALVECVCMDPLPSDLHLSKYIEKKLRIKEYKVFDREMGTLPLSTHSFTRQESERLYRIGASAGMIKATTGFGFTRILRDTELIVEGLKQDGVPKFYQDKKIIKTLDTHLLNMMLERPQLVPEVTLNMYENYSADTIFSFFDGDVSNVAAMNLAKRMRPLLMAEKSLKGLSSNSISRLNLF